MTRFDARKALLQPRDLMNLHPNARPSGNPAHHTIAHDLLYCTLQTAMATSRSNRQRPVLDTPLGPWPMGPDKNPNDDIRKCRAGVPPVPQHVTAEPAPKISVIMQPWWHVVHAAAACVVSVHQQLLLGAHLRTLCELEPRCACTPPALHAASMSHPPPGLKKSATCDQPEAGRCVFYIEHCLLGGSCKAAAARGMPNVPIPCCGQSN